MALLPFGLGFGMLDRGFFDAPGSADASFITIFAWISSNLPAFTFFGQKRVTKLQKKVRRVENKTKR